MATGVDPFVVGLGGMADDGAPAPGTGRADWDDVRVERGQDTGDEAGGVRTFRPAGGRVVAVGVGVVAVASLWASAASGGSAEVFRYGAVPLLVALWAWAAFWRPEVEVSDGGVRLTNVVRSAHVPWPTLRGVDSAWSLRLETTDGVFTAWGAPGRSGTAARLEAPRTGEVSGRRRRAGADDVALEIVARWAALRAAGHLDRAPRLPVHVEVSWHRGTLAALGALSVLATVGLFAG